MSTSNHCKVYGGKETSAVLRLFGTSWGPCGYCKGTRSHLSNRKSLETNRKNHADASNCSCSYAVYAQHIDPALYEQMICNGWRRSGNVIYLPNNELSCCPTYPIRLPVNDFAPSKSQRKVVKQVHNLAKISPLNGFIADSAGHCDIPRDGALNELQTSRMTRRKLDHPTTRSGNDDISRKQNKKILHDAVYQSYILKLLCKWTESALVDVLRTTLSDDSVLEATVHSLPLVQYRVKPTKKQSQPMSSYVTCFSTICAAIVGKSKGLLHRGDFVHRVVLELQKQHTAHQSQLVTSLDETNEIDTGVTIQSIDCHLDSGQILVSFIVDASKVYTAKMERVVLRNSESGSSSSTTSSKRTMEVYPTDDPIQRWWKQMSGMEGGVCIPSQRSPLPPYDVSVTTIPAHESALDPQVHQLYWHYQHMVHGECDPRIVVDQGTISQERMMNIGVAPVLNGNSEDNPAFEDVLNDHGTISDGNDNANIDWGQHAPNGWRESAIQMLNKEYRHCPTTKLQQLVAAFGSFYEFLVENPFLITSNSSNVEGNKRGFPLVTYHQHYTLSGGILVAVGVIDILPGGLSSVYVFYNPSFADSVVPMGKYSTMKEIEFTRQSVQASYYYLGYYIHSCSKMNYKSDYKPSAVLCPVTKQWVDADQAKSIIEAESPDHNYCPLFQMSSSSNGKDDLHRENGQNEKHTSTLMDHIALDLGFEEPVPFGTLSEPDQKLVRPALEEFVDFIGINAALRCTIDLRG